jgi:predicted nucleotidyltransferase
MIQLIEKNIDQIRQLFQFHQIEKAYIFGSALTSDFNNESDLDFLIKFRYGLDPLEKGEHWWNLHYKLRELFNR